MKIVRVLCCLLFVCVGVIAQKQNVLVVSKADGSTRLSYAADKLSKGLQDAGYSVSVIPFTDTKSKGYRIYLGLDAQLSGLLSKQKEYVLEKLSDKESFALQTITNGLVISGFDASGVLYGCVELINRIKEEGSIPQNLRFTDKPEMVLRGACVGLQKPVYLPGHDVYEYPYTPENFPWFYDKDMWVKYLDMLVNNRMNSLYLWNGHPFASLVKLPDYPYALEVDEATFKKNEEIFAFLTKEADKRGIFVIQMFYNIILSKPFADHHGLKTQDRSREITPLIADYTRKSVAAFIEKYPNVGLLVCLGEAINSHQDDVDWFTKTIIPGVKDGLQRLGRTDEPPILLRAHDTDAKMVMDAALPMYKNLYTMSKYNGESLTTYQPRGPWTKTHRDLSSLGSVHISNVHILANLEPFRYSSPDFIRKAVLAMHNEHGANGLHLYPQASYWDWPYTADKAEKRILQLDRDWMWYQTWARYAWNCHRAPLDEVKYWSNELSDFYGCPTEKAANIVEAYDQMGEIAPKLLRRFGITDGNRQTLLLGMFMSQLVNPVKWRIYPDFYASNGPEGEILIEYALKEFKKESHKGETPPQIIAEVVEHGNKAVAAIEKATDGVTVNKEEFMRLRNDVYCYQALANCFNEKVQAAIWVLKYNYSKQLSDLEQAIPYLEKSVEHYKRLVDLTRDSYQYANSMQTAQRRIPAGGNDGKNKTWEELLPQYMDECNNFKRNVATLKNNGGSVKATELKVLEPVKVTILSGSTGDYANTKEQKVYSDKAFSIDGISPEFAKLKGVAFNYDQQLSQGTLLKFKNDKPVKVVVGYFNGSSQRILNPPSLETNASANDRGQAEIRIANALTVRDLFPVNVYTYDYAPGVNELKFEKGLALVLGFIDGNEKLIMHDAGVGVGEDAITIDWLFY